MIPTPQAPSVQAELPPLPEPMKYLGIDDEPDFEYFTARQMQDYAREALAAQLSRLQAGGGEVDLHGAIMNLPCKTENMDDEPNQRLAYKVGHRDARHASAELVATQPPAAPAPLKSFAQLRERNQEGIAEQRSILDAELAAAPALVPLSARIKELIAQHKTLRGVARYFGIDVGYLSRLERGEKTNPSPDVLAALGLREVVAYERINGLTVSEQRN